MLKTKLVLTLFLIVGTISFILLLTSPTTKKLAQSSISFLGPSEQKSPSTTPSPSLASSKTGAEVFPKEKASNPSEPQELLLVKKVVDGDTIELENGQKVRYIGIDTPETVDPRRKVQCFGREASNKNKELVEGKEVRLEKDVSETDSFGRLLRYVFLSDGTFVNELLVKAGFAKSSSYPPDVKYQELFRQAEMEARENNRGLWSVC